MPTFEIDGRYYQADTEEIARRLHDSLILKAGDCIYLKDSHGNGNVIDVPADGYLEIWTKSGNSVQYCGKLQGGVGQRIIQAAIDSVNRDESQRAKIGQATRKARAKRRHDDNAAVINNFESTLPELGKALYNDVMGRMEATTEAYKLEIIDGLLENSVEEVRSQNWIPILTWFRDKVLADEESKPTAERRTFFLLRKAFVTAATRMVKDDVRHANTMKLVVDDGTRGSDFWSQYAEKQGGS